MENFCLQKMAATKRTPSQPMDTEVNDAVSLVSRKSLINFVVFETYQIHIKIDLKEIF